MALLYYTGQDVALSATVLDDTGAPAAGDLAVTLTVTDPAGTVSTPSPAAAGGGVYLAVVPAAAVPGTWLYRWTATGAGVGWVDEGQFTVRPAGAVQLVDLPSVKAHLNIPSGDVRQDAELQNFILMAAEQARYVCGPLLAEDHTEWHDGGTAVIALDWQPVLSVQSVTEYVAASTFPLHEQPYGSGGMDSYGYTLDLESGTITRRAVGDAVPFPPGRRNVRVVYTAGAANVPWSVRLGALELIRHMWQVTQQPTGRAWKGGGALDVDGGSPYPAGFALPTRVLELWAPYRREPGVA